MSYLPESGARFNAVPQWLAQSVHGGSGGKPGRYFASVTAPKTMTTIAEGAIIRRLGRVYSGNALRTTRSTFALSLQNDARDCVIFSVAKSDERRRYAAFYGESFGGS